MKSRTTSRSRNGRHRDGFVDGVTFFEAQPERMRSSVFTVCAAAAAAAAAAPATLSYKMGTAGSKSGAADSSAALAHVYENVLGVAGPGGPSAALAALPATDLLSRPSHALVVTVEGAARVQLSGAAPLELEGAAAVKVLRAAAAAAWVRAGLAGGSLEVAAPALGAAAALPGDGALLRWEPAAGFVSQRSSGVAAAYAGPLLGHVACSKHGVELLALAGVLAVPQAVAAAAGRGKEGACLRFTLPGGGAGQPELDAALPAVRQALSEAAAIIGAASALSSSPPPPPPSTSSAPGLVLLRVYAAGPAAALAAGLPAGVAAGCTRALEAAIAFADGALAAAAAAEGGAHAVVVLAGEPFSALRAAAARGLQVDPTDPCIDYGNCTTRSPAPAPGAAPGRQALAEGVAAFQIALWTAVLLAGALLTAAYVLLGMDARKDPALYVSLVDAARGAKRD